MRRNLILILLLSSCLAIAAPADDTDKDKKKDTPATISSNDHGDQVLKAMLAELRRSQEKLQLEQLQRPYYIDYEVTELQDFTVDATLGALRTEQKNNGRLV